MRLFSTSLKQRLLLAAMVPGLLAALLVGLATTWTYLHQIESQRNERWFSSTQYLARMAAPLLATANTAALAELGNTSLDIPSIRSITFYDNNRRMLTRAGPDPYPLTGMDWPPTAATQSGTRSTMHYFQPVENPTSHNTAGWLDVEYSSANLDLVLSNSLVFLTLTLMIATCCSVVLAAFLFRHSLRSLAQLDEELRQVYSGDRSTPLSPADCLELDQLVQSLNTTIEKFRKQILDMQEHVNQSTEDLRETLETIEIQNIELDMARKEAVQASRVKSEFLANTSHEIRTPLNGIIGFTRLLLKQCPDPQQREYLTTIQQSSETLLNIINDILDLSKIEAGKLVLDHASFNIHALIEETLQILAPAAHEKGLELVHIIPADVPEFFFGDALRLKQILTNLIGNAIKFSSTGGITVRVTVEKRHTTSTVIKFSVSDSGIGIRPSQLNKDLFNAFSQAGHHPNHQRDSTGLGLAISKKLVDQMGGDIGIDSAENVGSTFWFTLNLDLDSQSIASASAPPAPTGQVLLFDTNAASRQAISTLLTHNGTTVALTESYNDIVPALASNSQLPQAQWFSATIISLPPDNPNFPIDHLGELVRNIRCYCPVVICTPTTLKHYLNKTLPAGTVYVSKPVTREKLFQALHVSAPVTEDLLPVDVRSQHPASSVLVVDDNPANLRLLGSLLRDLGLAVTEAGNGIEAVNLCHQQAFDLVLMDIRMPGMDGIEATKRIRALNNRNRATPVVAVTAQASADQKQHLLLSGLDDYLSKPINELQLNRMLSKWLRAVAASNDTRTPDPDEVEKCVDTEQCVKLSHGKARLAAEMLSMLLNELALERREINSALQEGRYHDAHELVHKLHGAACYCGVPELQSSCRILEQQLKTQPALPPLQEVSRFNAAVDMLLAWKERYDISALFDL